MVLLLLFLFLPLPHHPPSPLRLKACLSRSPRPRSPSQAPALPEASSLSSLPSSPLQSSCSLPIFVCVPLLSLPPADISLQDADLASLSTKVSPSVEGVLPGQNLPPHLPPQPGTLGEAFPTPGAQPTKFSLPAHLLPSPLPICLSHRSLCLSFCLSYLFYFVSDSDPTPLPHMHHLPCFPLGGTPSG